jgi:hypothetical protein
VQASEVDEVPFNWSAAPLLRGQRRLMVPMCGMRKPILSRVPNDFTFSTHNMRAPLFYACAPDKWGSTADCLEPALWIVHLKCARFLSLLRAVLACSTTFTACDAGALT